jgi:hypothetical protein
MLVAFGITSKRHGAALCAIDTWRSATERLPCLATGSAFSATRNETVPSP